uniref:PHD-type domain-containing protein n=2 Tax=Clastoptera arizonana TaxID=38151 RepID=A0A1B6D8S1_9HEMI
MSDPYGRNVLKVVVAQICQTIGWNAIQSTPLELLTDILQKYIYELGRTAHRYGEQFGHTVPMLEDVSLAFRDMSISTAELQEYVEYVASVPCQVQVPKYPVPRESHLNLLKPGSREVVTRPVHIHEHLPAMHPQLEDDDYTFKQTALSVETNNTNETISPPLSSPKSNLFKRPGDPVSFETHSMKKARLLLEEEGRPLREISSVMMTTSGYLSPAREGKLPEARTPVQPFDSRSNSPQPLSYPTVPPEVKGEKKGKKNSAKMVNDSGKKLFDKENSKLKEGLGTDILKLDSDDVGNDDLNVKKLVSMKEMSKLKALKSGAMKLLGHNNPTGSAVKPKQTKHNKAPIINNNINTNMPIAKVLKVNLTKNPKLDKVTSVPKKLINTTEKSKDLTGFVEGKISSEPDKQKLNILKKISKVKEEKNDTGYLDLSKIEHSPIISISDSDMKQKEVRLAQIRETIEDVIQRSQELYSEPSMKQEPEDAESSEAELFPYDDNISPPGTPTTPRTPDLVIPPRKSEKSLLSKKKKKDKNKEKKDRANSPKRFKSETFDSDYINEKPKTPEVELNRDDILSINRDPSTPVFPFYSHYPGLIPPYIPHMNNIIKPVNLLPPGGLPRPGEFIPTKPKKVLSATVTSSTVQPVQLPAPSLSPVSILSPPVPPKIISDKLVIQQSPPKVKNSEKEKKKEHKKDKKDKIKKKKDKKYKLKNKDKSEKKKEKGEKKERDKEKNKEKKEKKKREKEREEKEKFENSVPKITLKLSPLSPPKIPTPEPPQRKIIIKPVVKKAEDVVKVNSDISETNWEREKEKSPSPELARISALVTRPPKTKSLSKTHHSPLAHIILPVAETPSHSISIPQSPSSSILIQPKKLVNSIASNSTNPKIKMKGVQKKSKECEVVKETVGFYFDNDGNQIWICPACGKQDDGSPMIGCDGCDAWYHWVCVGIQLPPDSNDWFCKICISKKDEFGGEKKKKIRKKKAT